jgi:hypothetical protein
MSQLATQVQPNLPLFRESLGISRIGRKLPVGFQAFDSTKRAHVLRLLSMPREPVENVKSPGKCSAQSLASGDFEGG